MWRRWGGGQARLSSCVQCCPGHLLQLWRRWLSTHGLSMRWARKWARPRPAHPSASCHLPAAVQGAPPAAQHQRQRAWSGVAGGGGGGRGCRGRACWLGLDWRSCAAGPSHGGDRASQLSDRRHCSPRYHWASSGSRRRLRHCGADGVSAPCTDDLQLPSSAAVVHTAAHRGACSSSSRGGR